MDPLPRAKIQSPVQPSLYTETSKLSTWLAAAIGPRKTSSLDRFSILGRCQEGKDFHPRTLDAGDDCWKQLGQVGNSLTSYDWACKSEGYMRRYVVDNQTDIPATGNKQYNKATVQPFFICLNIKYFSVQVPNEDVLPGSFDNVIEMHIEEPSN